MKKLLALMSVAALLVTVALAEEVEAPAVDQSVEELEISIESETASSEALLASGDAAIDAAVFPDGNFRKFVKAGFDLNSDGMLSEAELANVRQIDVSGEEIDDLKGIERFTNLEYLNCSGCGLTRLVVDKNRQLTYIDCSNNAIRSLELAGNPALDALICERNALSALDIGGSKKLRPLVCADNSIKQLDLRGAPSLNQLAQRAEPVPMDDRLTFQRGDGDDLALLSTDDTVTLLTDGGAIRHITLKKSATASMNVGDKLIVDPDYRNGKTAKSYKSASKKIAKVSKSGLVTAVKEGKTKITVTLSNKKKLVLTVKVNDPYKPSSVSLNYSGTVNLELGKTLTLSPTLSPSTARTTYTWSTSSKKIAKVSSSGAVTPVKAGTATITVKTANGKKASVKVKVVKQSPSVQNPGELSGYIGMDSKTAAELIGGMKPWEDDWEENALEPGYANKYVTIINRTTVKDITLQGGKSDYSLFGVKVGMSRQEVTQALKSLKRLPDYSNPLVYVATSVYDEKYKQWQELKLYVGFDEADRVSYIVYGNRA